MIWALLLLCVAALGGLIAYAGDTVGRRIGKKHWRLFGLRPKTTGLVFAIFSGVAVALVTVGTVALLARNTLDTAIRAQEIQADLGVAKQQLNLVNTEYEQAKQDIGAAQTAQQKLETQLKMNNAKLELKQTELSSAVALIGRLKTSASELEILNKNSLLKLAARDASLGNLEAQRRALSLKIFELTRKRTLVQARIRDLTQEKQAFEERYQKTQERLSSTQQRLMLAQKRFQGTQARLDKLESQVRDFEDSRSTLEGDINELNQTKSSIEKSNQDLRAQNAQLEKDIRNYEANLKETRTALMLAQQGEFIYRRNELIVQTIIEGSADQLRARLQAVVRQAGLITESRGAARGKPLLTASDLEPFVTKALKITGAKLVMVRAARNLTRGAQIPIVLELRSNRILFPAAQAIRMLEFSLGTGNRPASEILDRLQVLLRDVRNVLRAKNVPLENINPPDVVPNDEVAEFADRLQTMSGTVMVAVAGRQDVVPSGPLRFYFLIVR